MVSPVTYREATPPDADALANIHLIAREAAMPWLPVLHTLDGTIAYFREHVIPTQRVTIAELQGKSVGFLACDGSWIEHLYVHPQHQNHKIGSTLLSLAKQASDELNLWTFQQNAAARRFYLRHGFEEINFTDGSRNEERTPDVHLRWSGERNPFSSKIVI